MIKKILQKQGKSVSYLGRWFIIGFFICICFAVFFVIRDGLDPDFGWHVKMGQLILARGIPHTDPFSYTMSSYPFVDHEWLTNVILALLYSRLGLLGLSLLFVLLAYCALLIQIIFTKRDWVSLPLLLSTSALSSYIGIRTQVLSWILFSFLLLVFLHKHIWKRVRFFLPVLFLLWVNLHAGFALGIVLLGLFLVLKNWETKRIHILDWIIFFCCIAVTFCNPYTYRIWWEVWMQMSDNSLHWSIQEWLPTFFFLNFGLLALLPFSVILIVLTRKRFSFTELFLYGILLLFGLESARNLPYWLIISIPLTAKALTFFIADLTAIPYAQERFRKAYVVYFMFSLLGISWQIFSPFVISSGKSPTAFYPDRAISYLRTHPSSGQIFSEYAWGGYLIWKLPEKKVFIDGRMPSWRRTSASASESLYAFRDYQRVLSGDLSFLSVAQKYHIDTVLVFAPRTSKMKPTWENALENLLGIDQVKVDFRTQMQRAGMMLVYKDNIAAIYRKE